MGGGGGGAERSGAERSDEKRALTRFFENMEALEPYEYQTFLAPSAAKRPRVALSSKRLRAGRLITGRKPSTVEQVLQILIMCRTFGCIEMDLVNLLVRIWRGVRNSSFAAFAMVSLILFRLCSRCAA